MPSFTHYFYGGIPSLLYFVYFDFCNFNSRTRKDRDSVFDCLLYLNNLPEFVLQHLWLSVTIQKEVTEDGSVHDAIIH